jgi:hypothetical protein
MVSTADNYFLRDGWEWSCRWQCGCDAAPRASAGALRYDEAAVHRDRLLTETRAQGGSRETYLSAWTGMLVEGDLCGGLLCGGMLTDDFEYVFGGFERVLRLRDGGAGGQ